MAAGSELRLLLTVPYVQTEVLAVVKRRGSRGVAYDPLSTRNPVPWSSDCPECRMGWVAAPLKVRRVIQALCTARTTSSSRYDLQVVVGRDTRYHLAAGRSLAKGGKWIVVVVRTRNPDPRSPVLRRMITMIESAREVSESPRESHSGILEKLGASRPSEVLEGMRADHPHAARDASSRS